MELRSFDNHYKVNCYSASEVREGDGQRATDSGQRTRVYGVHECICEIRALCNILYSLTACLALASSSATLDLKI